MTQKQFPNIPELPGTATHDKETTTPLKVPSEAAPVELL